MYIYTGILDLKNDSPILRGYKQNLIITFLPNMSIDITGHIPMSHTVFNNFHLFRQYFMSLKEKKVIFVENRFRKGGVHNIPNDL